jgi:hypothetical protein
MWVLAFYIPRLFKSLAFYQPLSTDFYERHSMNRGMDRTIVVWHCTDNEKMAIFCGTCWKGITFMFLLRRHSSRPLYPKVEFYVPVFQ